MTSCARRCISGLPRCTEAKSRSAELAPAPIDDAAPPPRPISIAGPPSTTIFAPGDDWRLLDVLAADVAEAARDHDRLVIAAQRRAAGRLDPLLERAEVAADVGPAEFVVERRRADRALEHDLERRDDALRLAEVLLPRLLEARDAQVRHREARRGPPSACAPRPVAPSSRISPPEPVAAPGNGEIAVGWLCVSTFIRMSIGSSRAVVVAVARLREPAPATASLR